MDQYLDSSRLFLYEELAALVEPFHPRSVLDVGCGGGHLLRAVEARLSGGLELVGVDYSRTAITLARQILPRARWVAHDLYGLELGKKFDLVLCVEVLEHLEDPHRAMSRLAKHCAPDGHLVVTVPDGAVDRWEGHVNFWTEMEFRDWIEPWGLVDLERLDEDRILVAILKPALEIPGWDATTVR